MRKLKWGIIGTGTIANEFAQQFPKEISELYAVTSRNVSKAKSFAEKYKVSKVYESNEALIQDQDVDVVYIAVPHNHHFEIIMESLKGKKHVVCEKSITISKEQLNEAVKLAEKNDVYLFEAMTIHHMPLYQKLKQWIDENDIGPLKMVQVNFGSYKPLDPKYYFFNKHLAGGALFDIGVYALNFARWFLSSKPEEILTFGNIHETGVDESSAIILRNKEKELATISLTFRSKMPKQGIVAFERGYFKITNYPRADYATFTDCNGEVTKFQIGDTKKGLAYEVENITDIIVNEKENIYLPFTLDVLEMMDKIRTEWGLRYPFEEK